MNNRVLLTGSSGLLGIGLLQTRPKNFAISAIYHKDDFVIDRFKAKFINIDLTEHGQVSQLLRENDFEYVIHTMSLGNVDLCEKNKALATTINIETTQNMVNSLKSKNHKPKLFVFISSNAIFSGQKSPYKESEPTDPVNYYGYTKITAEKIVENSGLQYLIVRPVLMFGWNSPNQRQNPVTWIISMLQANREVKLVNDIYNNPILNTEVAEQIWKLINIDRTGIVHIAGAERINRYELGIKTAKQFNLNHRLIQEVDSSAFPAIAPRMPDTTFDTTLLQLLTNFQPRNVSDYLIHMKSNCTEWN